MQQGKVTKPGTVAKAGAVARAAAVPLAAGDEAPAVDAWAAAVLSEQPTLSSTGRQIVELARLALTTARDVRELPHVRLSAMGRFQMLSKQIDASEPVAAPAASRQTFARGPRRATTDPRRGLMAVK